MKKTYLLTGLVFFSWLLINCNYDLFDFNNPTIVDYYPARNDYGVNTNVFPYIIFSKAMNIKSVEDKLSFVQGSTSVPYSISWEENKVIISPQKSLVINKDYTLSIAKGAYDYNDNLLAEVLSINFSTKSINRSSFYVSNYSPSKYYIGITNLKPEITILFSQDLESNQDISTHVSLNPNIAGDFQISNRYLFFSPTKVLEKNTLYTITLSKDVSSSEGLLLEKEWKSHFYTGMRKTNASFVLERIFPPNALRLKFGHYTNYSTSLAIDRDIYFQFSEAVLKSTVKDNITFSPDISGYFEWLSDSVAIFKLEENLNYNEHYTMTLERGIQNVDGIALDQKYFYRLQTLNPRNQPLMITQATVSSASISNLNLNESIDQEVLYPLSNGKSISSFNLYLNSTNLNLTTIYKTQLTGLTCFVDCPFNVVKPTYLETVYNNSENYITVKYEIDFTNTVFRYIFTVDSSVLKTKAGLTLDRDYSFPFKTRTSR